jgi:hypothetical protein
LDRQGKTVPQTRKFGVLDEIRLARWLDAVEVPHRSDVVNGGLFLVGTYQNQVTLIAIGSCQSDSVF